MEPGNLEFPGSVSLQRSEVRRRLWGGPLRKFFHNEPPRRTKWVRSSAAWKAAAKSCCCPAGRGTTGASLPRLQHARCGPTSDPRLDFVVGGAIRNANYAHVSGAHRATETHVQLPVAERVFFEVPFRARTGSHLRGFTGRQSPGRLGPGPLEKQKGESTRKKSLGRLGPGLSEKRKSLRRSVLGSRHRIDPANVVHRRAHSSLLCTCVARLPALFRRLPLLNLQRRIDSARARPACHPRRSRCCVPFSN